MLPRLLASSSAFAAFALLVSSSARAQQVAPVADPPAQVAPADLVVPPSPVTPASQVAPASSPPPQAQDAPDEPADIPPGLRGPRLGITPGVGAGFVGFTGNVAFPSFVFTTAVQIELLLEITRWGFFLRGGFLSSGPGGRWNAPTVALGTQYRLAGDGEERWGMVVRGGALYERWSAVDAKAGCDVLYFIPNSCQDFVEPPGAVANGTTLTQPFTTTADSLGLLAALRVEVPVEPVYLAFDGELSASADIESGQTQPGLAIGGRLVLTLALRDHPKGRYGPDQYRTHRRVHSL